MVRSSKPVTRRDKEGKTDKQRGISKFERLRRDDMSTEGPKADSVPQAEKKPRRRRTVPRSRMSSIADEGSFADAMPRPWSSRR